MSRPEALAIDDLAQPRFSPAVAEMFNAMAAMGADVRLDVDALVDQAIAATGLDDFDANPAFMERLGVYVTALRDEADLSPVGMVTTQAQIVQLLSNRLLVTDFVARNPQILNEQIERPIVIVGLPRTGTTHLHNLMAADTTLRSLPYWESLEPVPTVAEQRGEQPDGRRQRCEAGVWFLNEALPEFKRMHEMTVDHVHEEIQLLAIDCSTMLFESAARIPSFRDYYKAHDQTSSYEYMKRVLQVCQFQRPGARPTRWVLKSPQHLEQIPALLKVFPDATLVFTHRDPVSVIVSFATMGAYTARLSRTPPIDLHEFGSYWCDRILDLYAGAVRDRALVPEGQAIDVHFDEFMRDDIAMVERVYAVAGHPFDDTTRAAMAAFMEANPRGKHGAVAYDLAQFGLDAPRIRDAANEYISMFGINLEERW